MPNPNAKFDQILKNVQDTTARTRELLREADRAHGRAEAAHEKIEKLRSQIHKQREKARAARTRKK